MPYSGRVMIESLFLALALAAAPVQPAPQPSPAVPVSPASPEAAPDYSRLDAEGRARLRCAAAFSLATAAAERGERTLDPALRVSGREFFVVTLADLMDQYGLQREAVAAAVRAQAIAITKAGQLDDVLPACLLLLGAAPDR